IARYPLGAKSAAFRWRRSVGGIPPSRSWCKRRPFGCPSLKFRRHPRLRGVHSENISGPASFCLLSEVIPCVDQEGVMQFHRNTFSDGVDLIYHLFMFEYQTETVNDQRGMNHSAKAFDQTVVRLFQFRLPTLRGLLGHLAAFLQNPEHFAADVLRPFNLLLGPLKGRKIRQLQFLHLRPPPVRVYFLNLHLHFTNMG